MRQGLKLGVNAFLREMGVSKSSYYRLKRAEKRQTGRQSKQAQIEDEVRQMCDQLPEFGSPTIAAMLNRGGQKASESTVLRVMKRLKLLPKPYRRRRPKATPTPPPNPAEVGMTVGLDFTHWQKRPICNVLEYQSRYCLASLACPAETSLTARDALSAALAEAKILGLPTAKIEVKSDHGPVFTADAFESFITELGNWHTLSAVGRPQGMGRVERYNRNSKEQRLRWTDIQDAAELQTELSGYRKFYNEQRPHRALGGLTPIAFLRASRNLSVPLF